MQYTANQPVYLYAVRQILRFIKRTELKPGEHLPPDIKLPALVGCSDHAVRGAMTLLARQGIISRRRRHGTKILNPHLVPPGVWSVGITARPATLGPHLSFEAYLLHTIRAHFSEQEVMDRTIIEKAGDFVTQESELELLNPHLPTLLREDMIQGVVTCRRVAIASAPILHVGAWELAPWGVVVDTAAMVRVAIQRIYSSGTRRLAYVSHSKPHPGYNRGFLECMNHAGVLGLQVESIYAEQHYGSAEAVASEVCAKLMELAPRSRPKALIFVDDVLACLTSNILASTAGYRPEVYTIVNDDTLITFPLKTSTFSVDLDAMGRIAAKEMIVALGVEKVSNRIVWIEPKEDIGNSRLTQATTYSGVRRARSPMAFQHINPLFKDV